MKLRYNLIKLIFTLFISFLTLYNTNAQIEEKCLIDVCVEEVGNANSNQLLNHFEIKGEEAFDAWKVLYQADPNADRLKISLLEEVEEYLSVTGKSIEDVVEEIRKTELGYEGWKLHNHDINKLLQYDGFKEIYDFYKNGVYSKKFEELTLEEEVVFRFYTGDDYYSFNQALIRNSQEESVLEIEKLLNQALYKIKPSPGTYYRGIGKEEIEMMSRKKIGDEIIYSNHLSTSKNQNVSMDFASRNYERTGEGALVEIISKRAKSIEKYSEALETEFLHKSKSKFKIKNIISINDDPSLGISYKFILEEI